MAQYCEICGQVTNCTDDCKECLKEEETNMYKLELTIYPIADCGKDLKHGEPLVVSYEGNDVYEMKKDIDATILRAMRELNANDGETFVKLLIEHNGEYYDHDEQWIFVDLENNCVKHGIE